MQLWFWAVLSVPVWIRKAMHICWGHHSSFKVCYLSSHSIFFWTKISLWLYSKRFLATDKLYLHTIFKRNRDCAGKRKKRSPQMHPHCGMQYAKKMPTHVQVITAKIISWYRYLHYLLNCCQSYLVLISRDISWHHCETTTPRSGGQVLEADIQLGKKGSLLECWKLGFAIKK